MTRLRAATARIRATEVDLRVLLDMAVEFDPTRVALSDIDGARLTTGDLRSLASAAAGVFRASGRHHVAFCAPNGSAFPIAMFGATLAGLPFVPLNYRLADGQLAQIVEKLDPVVVADGEHGARLRRLGVSCVVDPSELRELGPAVSTTDSVAIEPDDVALLLHTSGTTSAPKAAVLRHRHLAAYVFGTVEFGAADPTAAVLVSVPPYHIAGVMNLLTNLYSGRRIVYLDRFDPDAWLAAVRRESITHAMVVPTMLSRILAALEGRDPRLPSLESLSYGGARMPAPVIEAALRVFAHVDFTNAYGLTETSSTVTVLGPDDHRDALMSADSLVRSRLHSVGRAVPGVELEVRDNAGSAASPREVGDVFVRGEQIAGEYAGTEHTTSAWFATRDRGYLDEGGYLFLEGRADDTIIRGGENIAPAEIEDALLGHESVADCAVVGIDDDEWGHRIAAAIVLTPGSSATVDEIKAHARTSLRTSKTPDVMIVVSALPYTDTGKLLRRAVREELTDLLAASNPEPGPALEETR